MTLPTHHVILHSVFTSIPSEVPVVKILKNLSSTLKKRLFLINIHDYVLLLNRIWNLFSFKQSLGLLDTTSEGGLVGRKRRKELFVFFSKIPILQVGCLIPWDILITSCYETSQMG